MKALYRDRVFTKCFVPDDVDCDLPAGFDLYDVVVEDRETGIPLGPDQRFVWCVTDDHENKIRRCGWVVRDD